MLSVFALLMSAVALLCYKIILLTLAVLWPQVDIYLFSDWKHWCLHSSL